jgi:hypothetical protein
MTQDTIVPKGIGGYSHISVTHFNLRFHWFLWCNANTCQIICHNISATSSTDQLRRQMFEMLHILPLPIIHNNLHFCRKAISNNFTTLNTCAFATTTNKRNQYSTKFRKKRQYRERLKRFACLRYFYVNSYTDSVRSVAVFLSTNSLFDFR